jgi:hypothetical protein
MMDAGLTLEQALLAVEKMDEAKRGSAKSNAERQAEFRARQKAARNAVTSNESNASNVTSVTEPPPYTEDAHTHAEPEPNKTTNKGKNDILTDISKMPVARRYADWPADYAEQLWDIYPRKTEKKAGMEALARLHRADRVSWLEIVNGVEHLFGCDPQFVPALARWVKGERWKDERPACKPPPHRQANNRRSLADALHRIIPDELPEQPPYPRLAFGG